MDKIWAQKLFSTSEGSLVSPEQLLPVAVDDAIAVYRALLPQNISPSQLFTTDDSAEGSLSLLTVQVIISYQLPVPRGVIVLSPWADLSISGDSDTQNILSEVLYAVDDLKWIIKQVLGPNPSQLLANNSIFSHLFGFFEGFLSMYITVGAAEIIEDDSIEVVKRANNVDVNITFEIGLHMMHVYPLYFPYYPEARRTLYSQYQQMA